MYVENRLHVSVSFCGLRQGGAVGTICYKDLKTMYRNELLSFKYVLKRVTYKIQIKLFVLELYE